MFIDVQHPWDFAGAGVAANAASTVADSRRLGSDAPCPPSPSSAADAPAWPSSSTPSDGASVGGGVVDTPEGLLSPSASPAARRSGGAPALLPPPPPQGPRSWPTWPHDDDQAPLFAVHLPHGLAVLTAEDIGLPPPVLGLP